MITIILFVAAAVAVGVFGTPTPTKKKSAPYKDNLNSYVKEARAQGRQRVTIPADLVEYLGNAGTIAAEEAFSSSTVVLAHLLAKESFPRKRDIFTWNKFVIDEFLSEAKELPCGICAGYFDPPASFLPFQSGEFVLIKGGGKVVIDGVEIEQADTIFPQYEFNQAYVLLLITESPPRTAGTFGGPVGVFKVVNNDELLPVRESGHRVIKDFKEKYNSLSSLREHLKNRKRRNRRSAK